MPPIEMGPARRAGAIESRPARVTGSDPTGSVGAAKPATSVSAAPSVETSKALEAGQPPVDAERVALIRKAVESGTYPVVPAKIADAMIAAGMLLRTTK